MNNQPFIIAFYGPRGAGKTTASIIIARTLIKHGFDAKAFAKHPPLSDAEHSHFDDLTVSFDEPRPIGEVLE